MNTTLEWRTRTLAAHQPWVDIDSVAAEVGWTVGTYAHPHKVCPLRGYLEFYRVAREEPTFRAHCDEAFGWVAHHAQAVLYQHFQQRWLTGLPA